MQLTQLYLALQGTGSVGLARKLCEQQVSPTEAAALAELPLPPVLQRLERIFSALNAVYSFLLNMHIQVTLQSYHHMNV